MLKARLKILLAAAIVLIAPALAHAQTDACVLLSSDITPYKEALKGFKGDFRGSVQSRHLETDPESISQITSELEKSECKVAIAMGSKALKFLKLRARNKPIVFAMTLSPSAADATGPNITGVYLEPSPGDTLSAIAKVFPNATSIGSLYSSASTEYTHLSRIAANSRGMKFTAISVSSVPDAVREIRSIVRSSDIVWMMPDPITSSRSSFKALLESSMKNGVPIFALSQKHVKAGAIATLATSYRSNGRQAALIAQKIVNGTPPSSIPPEYAEDYGLVLNIKSADRMGITIPDAAIRQAVEIYR